MHVFLRPLRLVELDTSLLLVVSVGSQTPKLSISVQKLPKKAAFRLRATSDHPGLEVRFISVEINVSQ